MSLPSPLARSLRDDITVSVIFLGDAKTNETKDGVFVNENATGGGTKVINAKL